MLAHPQKHHRRPRRMNHADQTAHHIPHRVALADDKPVQPPRTAKRLVETPRLRHAIRPHQRFPDHQDLIRIGELSEFLQRGHQACVVVSPSRRVDEHHVEAVRRRVCHCVFGDVGCVFAVAFFVELDAASALSLG